MRFEQIIPQPESTAIDRDGLTFTFNTGFDKAQVQFFLRPTEFGSCIPA
ncbi:hypothetical protein [Pontibacter ummariensis]|nr:hypothetical protein [Pontibacter ummariensis]